MNMNRADKVAYLATVLVSCGITQGVGYQMAEEVLNKIFPPLEPIEHDADMCRDYIPILGGYEVQTKGVGSTFRLANANENFPFTGSHYEHEFLTKMAHDIRKVYGE